MTLIDATLRLKSSLKDSQSPEIDLLVSEILATTRR